MQGSIPGGGNEIPHALQPKNQNRNNIVANSIENIKNVHIQKKKKKRQLLCIFLDHMELDPLEIDVPSPEQLINRKARRNLKTGLFLKSKHSGSYWTLCCQVVISVVEENEGGADGLGVVCVCMCVCDLNVEWLVSKRRQYLCKDLK